MSVNALEMTGIGKRFGTTIALDDCRITVRRGTVHALLGENGAGKTTLMRIAFGMLHPDTGTMLVDGARRSFSTPAEAIDAGVGMVHQHFTNVPAMTVAENVALGHRGLFSRGAAELRVRRVAEQASLPIDPRAVASSLSIENQQRLEIVKALARDARLLVLDEPTAVLAPAQAGELLRWLRAFADAGSSVVLITHKLDEALGVADDVTGLRRGRTVLEASAGATTPRSLASALLGTASPTVEDEPAAAAPGGRRVAVAADHVSVVDARGVVRLRDATFEISTGEVVGVVGVEGAGQHELLGALARRLPVHGGKLATPPVGEIAFVPEDRHRDAMILDFTVSENVALRGAGERRGMMRWRRWVRRASELAAEFDVRIRSVHDPVRTMSGGNQQKLVLAREISEGPSLLVAENPTRGLDIRATRFVHDRLRAAAAGGAAVVVYSTDVDEVLSLATRLLVAHGGTVEAMGPDRERAGRAMLGVA